MPGDKGKPLIPRVPACWFMDAWIWVFYQWQSVKKHIDKILITLLVQAVFYTLIWMIHDYTALLLSAGVGIIALAILIISWLSDRMEYGNMPSWYYPVLWISFLVPLLISMIFWLLKGGQMDWMEPIF